MNETSIFNTKNFLIKMPYMRIPLVDKQRVVDAFQNDEDCVEAARLLGISRASAYDIVRMFEALERVGFRQEVRDSSVSYGYRPRFSSLYVSANY